MQKFIDQATEMASFLNSTINLVPTPTWLSHQTRPFITSTYFLTIDNPNPMDCSPAVGLVESFWYFLNNFGSSSVGIPGPSSCTVTRTCSLLSDKTMYT